MKKPFARTVALACLSVGTLFLLGLKAQTPDGQARYDRNMVFLPIVLAGDAQLEMDLQRLDPPGSRSRRRGSEVPAVGSVFQVVRSIKSQDGSAGPGAVLRNSVLRIPVIQWGARQGRRCQTSEGTLPAVERDPRVRGRGPADVPGVDGASESRGCCWARTRTSMSNL